MNEPTSVQLSLSQLVTFGPFKVEIFRWIAANDEYCLAGKDRETAQTSYLVGFVFVAVIFP